MKQIFDVDKAGLAKIMARRGISHAVIELWQNSADAKDVTEISIELTPIPGVPKVKIVVEDDSPHGFKDFFHAWTLFAESEKKADPRLRGRFNLGEKLVIAACDEAMIETTTGTVRFDVDGRHRSGAKLDRGSRFTGILKMTREQMEECLAAVKSLIVPPSVKTRLNGEIIPVRQPITSFLAPLMTEIAEADGILKRRTRHANVFVYEPLPGETPMIYELGVPVVETGDKYHLDVQQKVPLNLERDNVLPGFLRQVRTYALNATFNNITPDDATATWIKEATGSDDVSLPACEAVAAKLFGEKRVSFDPSDLEANKLAASQGYTVVPSRSFSSDGWDNMRRVIRPAGQVTPSPKPYSENGSPLVIVPEDKLTEEMKRVRAYAKMLGIEVLGAAITVRFTNDIKWPFAATYGPGLLTFNIGRLGKAWFEKINNDVDELLIHEFGHHTATDHLSDKYYDALCSIGAKMKSLALLKPEKFKEFLG